MSDEPSSSPDEGQDRIDAATRLKLDLARYAGLGAQFAATLAVLTLGGYWLDGRLGTLPLFLLIGVLLGSVGGTIAIVKKVPPAGGTTGPRPPTP